MGDVPLSFLNAFVLYTDELGSESARYLLVHFGLQLALIGCLALPFHLHNDLRNQRAMGGDARGRHRHSSDVPYADEDEASDPRALPAEPLEEADMPMPSQERRGSRGESEREGVELSSLSPVEDTHRNGNGGRSPAPVRPQSIDSGAIPVVLAPPPVNHAREESSKPAKVMSLDMD